MSLTATCRQCGAQCDGLAEYDAHMRAHERTEPTCSRAGRDWAGRLMHCTLAPNHPGRHIGALGGPLR